MSDELLNVHIMGRNFAVKCPAEKTTDLEQAAAFLDSKMREIKAGGKVISFDLMAIMAGLNIANELLAKGNSQQSYLSNMGERIQAIQAKVEQTLSHTFANPATPVTPQEE